MGNLLSLVVSNMNWFPGVKTKLAAVAAFLLAIIAAWNGLAPSIGVDFQVVVPEAVNSFVLALLGVGAANQITNQPKP